MRLSSRLDGAFAMALWRRSGAVDYCLFQVEVSILRHEWQEFEVNIIEGVERSTDSACLIEMTTLTGVQLRTDTKMWIQAHERAVNRVRCHLALTERTIMRI
jgi:hypothetical protein